jgi:predicted metalloprotease
MTFRRGARIDTGQVRDRRGMRMSPGLAIGGGGGLIGVIALLLFMALGGNLGAPGEQPGGGGGGLEDLVRQPVPGDGSNAGLADCQTGADANAQDDCRIVGYVNSIQEYWNDAFAEVGNRYQPAVTTFFDSPTQTGCGTASSETGPFYCPTDRGVYMDLGFFQILQSQFGASAGPMAQAYVVSHEYGHHVQNLLGDLGARDPGAEGGSVRTELQADCYAGVWAANAVDTGYLVPPTDAQITDALSAAAAVGDDRIQRATTGTVDPHKFSHGTSEQRQEWFMNGYRSGDRGACDTFRVDI